MNTRRAQVPNWVAPATTPATPSGPTLPPSGLDYETNYRRFVLPDATTSPLGIIPVLSTSRRWKGIDLYFSPGAPNIVQGGPQNFFSVAIFARFGASRVLVGTGRYGSVQDAIGLPIRIASVRVPISTVFEVWFENTNQGGKTVELHYVASDEAEGAAEDFAGAIGVGIVTPGLISGATSISTIRSAFPFELLAVDAACAVAAARFVHVHDLASGAAFNAVAPRFVFGLKQAGDQVSEAGPMLRASRFSVGVSIVASTTAPTTTVAALNDVAMGGWVR